MSTEAKNPPKPISAPNLGQPAGLVVKTVAVFVISQFIAVLLVELAVAILYRGRSQDVFNSSITAQFFFVLIAESLAVWLVWFLLKRRKLSLAAIGFSRRPKKSDLAWAAKGYAAAFLLAVLSSVIVSVFLPHVNLSQKQNLGFNNISGASGNVLAFIALVILPPLGEEPLMRGYLFSGLRRHWRFVWALAATSLLFGLAHLEVGSGTPLVWGAAIETFFLSAVLCYLREKTGVLYAGILVHMLNNVLAFFVTYH